MATLRPSGDAVDADPGRIGAEGSSDPAHQGDRGAGTAGVVRRLSTMYSRDRSARASRPSDCSRLLLIALYSVRSERHFCERLQYDLLFKWFLDMNPDDPAFDPTTFSKNRERLLKHEVAQRSSRRCGPKPSAASCSPTSTSRWTARSWRRGPR